MIRTNNRLSEFLERTLVGSSKNPPLTFTLGVKLGRIEFLIKKALMDIKAGIQLSKDQNFLEVAQNVEHAESAFTVAVDEVTGVKTLSIVDRDLLNTNSIYLLLSKPSIIVDAQVVIRHDKILSPSCDLCKKHKTLNLKHKTYQAQHQISPAYISHKLKEI